MTRASGRILLTALALLWGSPLAALAQQAKPASPKTKAGARSAAPVARYQIDAYTTNSLGIRMPSMGALMGGASVGLETTTTRRLELLLTSSQVPSMTPRAEHVIPSGLQLGASLPLASGLPGPAGGEDRLAIEPKGKGRILSFWGCGAQAGPGQPAVLEFASLDADKLKQTLRGLRPTAADREAPGTRGNWPSGSEAPAIPLTGSLVGDHTVTGNYSPDIRFSLTPSQDFLAPLNLKTSPEGGALRLSWNGIDHILGLEAEVVGKGAGSDDVVIWTSSTSREGRGKSQGELLPPDRTSCVMSVEARKAMELPMASLTAYGKAVTLRGPGWQVDLERRSSASVPPFEGIDGKGAEQPTAPKGGGGFNPFKLF